MRDKKARSYARGRGEVDVARNVSRFCAMGEDTLKRNNKVSFRH